jgi:hemolysin-activating ACP:hemolysin acyltransferase
MIKLMKEHHVRYLSTYLQVKHLNRNCNIYWLKFIFPLGLFTCLKKKILYENNIFSKVYRELDERKLFYEENSSKIRRKKNGL